MTDELYEYLFSVNVAGMVAKVTIPEHSHVAEIQLYGLNEDNNDETNIRYMISALSPDINEMYQLLHRYDEFLKWFNKELHIDEKLRGMYVGQEISDELIQRMETTVNTSIWSYNHTHEGEDSVTHTLFAMLLGSYIEPEKPAVKPAVYVKLPRFIPEGEKNPNINRAVNGVTQAAVSAIKSGMTLPVIFSNLIDPHAINHDKPIGTVVDIGEQDATIELLPEVIPTKKVQYLLQHTDECYISVVYYYDNETNSAQTILGCMVEWMKPNANYPNTPEMNILLNNIAESGFCAKVTPGKTESAYHVSIQPNISNFKIDECNVEEFKARYQQFEDTVFRKTGLDGTIVVVDETLGSDMKIGMIQDIYTDAFSRYEYAKSVGIANDFLTIMGADRMENEE